MINEAVLKRMIQKKIPFKLGTRGICADFTPNDYGWTMKIPRAFAETVEAAEPLIIEDGWLIATCDSGYIGMVRLDLSKYSKLSRLDEVKEDEL